MGYIRRSLRHASAWSYYRVLEDSWGVTVAPIEGFERWGPSTTYGMRDLPCTKKGLMKLVEICKYLTKNLLLVAVRDLKMPIDVHLGPLDIGAVYEIDATALQRLEVLDEISNHLQSEVGSWLPDGIEVYLEDIESLVDIVMGEV